MNALRQEALQIVNNTPDNVMAEFVEHMKNFNAKNNNSIENTEKRTGVDPRKAAAIKAIEEWQERNRAILESGIDWDKERDIAMEEKYGSFN